MGALKKYRRGLSPHLPTPLTFSNNTQLIRSCCRPALKHSNLNHQSGDRPTTEFGTSSHVNASRIDDMIYSVVRLELFIVLDLELKSSA